MDKVKISLIIVVLLTVSALLIVNTLSKENSGHVLTSDQINTDAVTTKSQPLKPDIQETTIETKLQQNDDNDTADHSENVLSENPPSSGLDIMTEQEQLAEQFNNEEQDYHWSDYWESELQTIVLFVGAKALVKDSEAECKSSTCEVTVNLSVDGPQNTVMAVDALSQEFAQREMKFVPESIDPATGKIVFYTQPGDIPE